MTVSSEERMKILKMIQEGKLTAQEGMELLDTLDVRPEKSGPAQPPTPSLIPPLPIRESRWFRVVVTDTTTGKTRVNVRLPISLVSAGMKMGAKFSPQVEGLDSEKLMELLRSGETGRVLDVVNKEDTERVEVFIE